VLRLCHLLAVIKGAPLLLLLLLLVLLHPCLLLLVLLQLCRFTRPLLAQHQDLLQQQQQQTEQCCGTASLPVAPLQLALPPYAAWQLAPALILPVLLLPQPQPLLLLALLVCCTPAHIPAWLLPAAAASQPAVADSAVLQQQAAPAHP
jgi:hypothetical protein